MQKIKSVVDFLMVFRNEETCIRYLERMRFPNGVVCSKCNSCNESYFLKTRKIYKCKKCNYQFSIKKGTIFEECRISLQKCFLALWMLTSNKKGISSTQLANELGIQQKSAWFLMHRIREIIRNIDLKGTLSGIIEIDETFIGGKEKNKHQDKKLKQGRGTIGKVAVMGAISREKKQAVASPVPRVNHNEVETFLKKNVDTDAMLMADECTSYDKYTQLRVNHSKKQYVDNMVHTNTIESFWATIKRGYIGIYHHWSKKHLRRYIDEFCFRYNHKNKNIFFNMNVLLSQCSNLRLSYKELIK